MPPSKRHKFPYRRRFVGGTHAHTHTHTNTSDTIASISHVPQIVYFLSLILWCHCTPPATIRRQPHHRHMCDSVVTHAHGCPGSPIINMLYYDPSTDKSNFSISRHTAHHSRVLNDAYEHDMHTFLLSSGWGHGCGPPTTRQRQFGSNFMELYEPRSLYSCSCEELFHARRPTQISWSTHSQWADRRALARNKFDFICGAESDASLSSPNGILAKNVCETHSTIKWTWIR